MAAVEASGSSDTVLTHTLPQEAVLWGGGVFLLLFFLCFLNFFFTKLDSQNFASFA